MGSERILTDTAPREVLAERHRLTALLMVVADELIGRHAAVTHPVARALLEGFGAEVVLLRKAVREAWTEEEFRSKRELDMPVAEETKEGGRGDAQQRR